MAWRTSVSRELGDFQTPADLVRAILACLNRSGRTWTRVLEPTCGRGNFIEGVLAPGMSPREVQGIEIQERYVTVARQLAQLPGSVRVSILKADIFRLHLGR